MKSAKFVVVAALLGGALPAVSLGQVDSRGAETAAEAELARIRSQRVLIEGAFASEEQACYQKFAVYDCVGRARAVRREAMADLRRQELAVNASEARRRGAEQISRTEEKLSPQTMREAEQRLLDAQAGQQERLKSIDQRAAERNQAALEASDRAKEFKARADANAAEKAERAGQEDARRSSRVEFEKKQQAAQKRQEDGAKRRLERKATAATPPAKAAPGVPANPSGR